MHKPKLTIRQVSRRLPEYQAVMDLFQRAFPENEQMPMLFLRIMALRRGFKFQAYYDGDTFCGFTYTIENRDMVFVLYLAVNDRIRSRGYGTAILQALRSRSGGKAVALNVEPPDERAANREQRVRRLKFYSRNGIDETGYFLSDKDGRYMILCSENPLPMDAYRDVIGKLSFHLSLPTIARLDPQEK